MAVPRKIFRIEEMAAVRVGAEVEDARTPRHAEIMQELAALRATLAAAAPRPAAGANFGRLISELQFIHSIISGTQRERAACNGSGMQAAPPARIANELEAVVKGSEQATQKILAAAEDIDQAANTLSAALKDDLEQGLAQDMRDRVIQIFEACNYQDLISQRVAKVMAALSRIEQQVAHALEQLTGADTAPAVHGPRLPNDQGHVSQSEVDSMFGGGARRCGSA